MSKKTESGNLEKDEGKCFNCRGIDHFACDCKVKKNNVKQESYDKKYK